MRSDDLFSPVAGASNHELRRTVSPQTSRIVCDHTPTRQHSPSTLLSTSQASTMRWLQRILSNIICMPMTFLSNQLPSDVVKVQILCLRPGPLRLGSSQLRPSPRQLPRQDTTLSQNFTILHFIYTLKFYSGNYFGVLPLRRIPFRRIPLRRIPLCRIPLCRIPLCRIPLCRIPPCRIPLCRIPLRVAPRSLFQQHNSTAALSSIDSTECEEKMFFVLICTVCFDL